MDLLLPSPMGAKKCLIELLDISSISCIEYGCNLNQYYSSVTTDIFNFCFGFELRNSHHTLTG